MPTFHQPDNPGPAIRIVLCGVSRMLSEIIATALADEDNMLVIDGCTAAGADLDDSVRRGEVDVVIFTTGAANLGIERIEELLTSNPRLGLIEIAPQSDGIRLHHLAAAHEGIGSQTRPTLTGAIRVAAALRRR
jgi:hypothetical protein